MGVLEEVTGMKAQGISDTRIIQILQEEGIPPKEINDAMAQSQIKNAVSNQGTQDMQQSIMSQEPTPMESYEEEREPDQMMQAQQGYAPQEEGMMDYNQGYTQEAYPQEAYPQQYPASEGQDYGASYGYDYGGGYAGGTDTGTLIEIAEQIFSEKIRKIQNQLDSLNEFKSLTQTRMITMEGRLKRMETMIDQLQLSILDKVGSYGQNLSSIKKEMTMMQDSFGKMINKATAHSEPINTAKKRR